MATKSKSAGARVFYAALNEKSKDNIATLVKLGYDAKDAGDGTYSVVGTPVGSEVNLVVDGKNSMEVLQNIINNRELIQGNTFIRYVAKDGKTKSVNGTAAIGVARRLPIGGKLVNFSALLVRSNDGDKEEPTPPVNIADLV